MAPIVEKLGDLIINALSRRFCPRQSFVIEGIAVVKSDKRCSNSFCNRKRRSDEFDEGHIIYDKNSCDTCWKCCVKNEIYCKK